MKKVRVIGAGLAGSEAAYQLAQRGYFVELFEAKTICPNPVQKTAKFGELVCSNSLRSNSLNNAVGTLKQELRLLDSLVVNCADQTKIPAGGSLAVDRELFSALISEKIRNHPNIQIQEKEFTTFDLTIPTIVASGPLTTANLQTEIQKLIGGKNFYFFDAVAPIIQKESINQKIVFKKNRYDKGETADYYNCPLNQKEYEDFYQALIDGETSWYHLPDEESFLYFEGCMPIEVMAKRGKQTLLFGPLKPQGLNHHGQKHHAVVQLRQDDASGSLYNLVGFQTNLKWKEQKRIFSMIPGLEQAEFVRYGVMHKNNFLNSPLLLNSGLQLKSQPNIFFAGQIIGVEGYVESAMSGLVAAINLGRYLQGKTFLLPDPESVSGALLSYILNASTSNFQPMKANWGITPVLTTWAKQEGKEAKKQKYSMRALTKIQNYCQEIT